jgi:hypothetical protein
VRHVTVAGRAAGAAAAARAERTGRRRSGPAAGGPGAAPGGVLLVLACAAACGRLATTVPSGSAGPGPGRRGRPGRLSPSESPSPSLGRGRGRGAGDASESLPERGSRRRGREQSDASVSPAAFPARATRVATVTGQSPADSDRRPGRGGTVAPWHAVTAACDRDRDRDRRRQGGTPALSGSPGGRRRPGRGGRHGDRDTGIQVPTRSPNLGACRLRLRVTSWPVSHGY